MAPAGEDLLPRVTEPPHSSTLFVVMPEKYKNLATIEDEASLTKQDDFTGYMPREWQPQSPSDLYPANRVRSYGSIVANLASECAYQTDMVTLAQGDSLELIKKLPDHSVDLVLTDPPYHSTKKSNIYGDADFAHDDEYRDWIKAYTLEWKRILRPNGSLYLFCSSDMAPFLYVDMACMMNMHGTITWTKPNEPGYDGWKQKMKKTALRKWYPHTERIIFCSPAMDGNLKRSPFGHMLKNYRRRANLSSNELTELIGAYGRVNNGGAVSNWETGRNIPSRDQYQKICKAITDTGKVGLMPTYEDVIRAFVIDPEKPFIDAWEFMNVRQYAGKHPAEKPQDMLDHIITTSSYPGDVVLDCFSGSGSTNLSALRNGRRSIGIEIEEKWIDYSVARLSQVDVHDRDRRHFAERAAKRLTKGLPLFLEEASIALDNNAHPSKCI